MATHPRSPSHDEEIDADGPGVSLPSAATPGWIPDSTTRATVDDGARPQWSVIVPFFNERDALAATLESLAAQSLPFRLILVDNGSTDGSAKVAAVLVARLLLDAVIIVEPEPGKVSALAAGLALVRTEFVATCDADTWYPPVYLAHASVLLDSTSEVTHAASAYFYIDRVTSLAGLIRAAHRLAASRLLPFQCHSGGAGQVFRTASLRSVGGFDPGRWNFVLEDHEIISRIAALGPLRTAYGFCCLPSPRERDRAPVRWKLSERLRYHLTRRSRQPQFFASYLAPRFAARGLYSHRLRERQHQV